MNGTIIDIPGINVSITPYDMQDSPDQAHTLIIKDKNGKGVTLNIGFGNINQIEIDDGKNSSSK